jgi:hypothetical protein
MTFNELNQFKFCKGIQSKEPEDFIKRFLVLLNIYAAINENQFCTRRQ